MLCKFSNEFPNFVSTFLQRGRGLKKQFREETVTDIMMASLINIGHPMIIVEYPNESLTGADMEWNFVNPHAPAFFRILLQAKRIYGEGRSWSRHSYRELFHVSGNKLQAEILCDTARAASSTYPLYILYNAQHTCDLASKAGAGAVIGANLADGFVIENLAKTSRKRGGGNSLGKIRSHLFFLSDLFCPADFLPLGPMGYSRSMTVVMGPGGLGFPVPPSPEMIRDRLIGAIYGEDYFRAERAAKPMFPRFPEVSREIPRKILELIEARGARPGTSEPLDKWRVTFVSPRIVGESAVDR